MGSDNHPPEVNVLHFLHSDWDTVSALAAEVQAPETRTSFRVDPGLLISRLCARLYALSRIEVELLYPSCVEQCALRESGSRMHDRMVRKLHVLLDAMVGKDPVRGCARELAEEISLLHRFEEDFIYPECDASRLLAIRERLVH